MACWLVKTEPSAYAFGDLVAEGKTAWTGVKNPQAQLQLRAMKKGDRVAVYHTGGEKAVVGTAVVTGAPRSDPTDPGREAGGRRAGAGASPGRTGHAGGRCGPQQAFAGSPLLVQGRLSVLPLSAAQWKLIEVAGSGGAPRVVASGAVPARGPDHHREVPADPRGRPALAASSSSWPGPSSSAATRAAPWRSAAPGWSTTRSRSVGRITWGRALLEAGDLQGRPGPVRRRHRHRSGHALRLQPGRRGAGGGRPLPRGAAGPGPRRRAAAGRRPGPGPAGGGAPQAGGGTAVAIPAVAAPASPPTPKPPSHLRGPGSTLIDAPAVAAGRWSRSRPAAPGLRRPRRRRPRPTS